MRATSPSPLRYHKTDDSKLIVNPWLALQGQGFLSDSSAKLVGNEILNYSMHNNIEYNIKDLFLTMLVGSTLRMWNQ